MKTMKKQAAASQKRSRGKSGVKSHAGHYKGAVIADERDRQMKSGDVASAENRQTEEVEGSHQRISDGQREDYNSNTASELNRQS